MRSPTRAQIEASLELDRVRSGMRDLPFWRWAWIFQQFQDANPKWQVPRGPSSRLAR
jgi:hypothetical protein